jgi:hypothetical protein
MWNRASSKTPVLGFNVPPAQPKRTAKAVETFARIADEHAGLQLELRELRQTRPPRLAEARQQAAEAALAGKPAKSDEAQVAAEIDAALASGAARLDALSLAVDQAGNTLAESIIADRGDWLDALDDLEMDARSRALRALAELRGALADLGPARAAPDWLRGFDLGLALTGSQAQFSGGRCDANTTKVRRESHLPVAELLAPLDALVAGKTGAGDDDLGAVTVEDADAALEKVAA